MHRTLSLSLSLFVSALLLAAGPVEPSLAAPSVVGVHVDNPHWQTREQQDAMLRDMHKAGVRSMRVPIVSTPDSGFQNSIDFVRRAWKLGIRTLANMPPQFADDVPRRPALPGSGADWPEPPMSLARPELMRLRFGLVLAEFERSGIELDGIEVGNEINWPPFNGDFALPGRGRIFDLKDLAEDPQGQRLAAGLDRYLRSVEVVKELRDASRLNRRTPIILAGLVATSPTNPTPGSPLDAIDLRATIRYLRARGLDQLVDAYGVHTYVGPGAGVDERRRHLAVEVFPECAPAGSPEGKPCWLTEWGIPLPPVCPATGDSERAAAARSYLQDFARYAEAGRLQARYWYDWKLDNVPHMTAIHRCGDLTETGRVVAVP
ncbi:hypothetical protein [Enterovirga sp.]|uniref:hypothetical protein n=1 Tax=Enterovirga sp. TaxID=2026350 RepID=UPI00260C4A64|nr:hypothetical protein [Enterovirga sp.]MDB5589574.1 hypothetical protein [Enterovirga sp.]